MLTHLRLVISVNIDKVIISVSNDTLSGVGEDTQKTRKQGDSISANFIFNHKARKKLLMRFPWRRVKKKQRHGLEEVSSKYGLIKVENIGKLRRL